MVIILWMAARASPSLADRGWQRTGLWKTVYFNFHLRGTRSAEQQWVNEQRLVGDVPSVPGEYSPHRADLSTTANCLSVAAQSAIRALSGHVTATTLRRLHVPAAAAEPTVRRSTYVLRYGVYRAMPKQARAVCQRRRRSVEYNFGQTERHRYRKKSTEWTSGPMSTKNCETPKWIIDARNVCSRDVQYLKPRTDGETDYLWCHTN